MSERGGADRLEAIGTMPVGRLLLRFSIPSIISMLVETFYNRVDRYFVGNGVGYEGIAGITLCFPIMLIIMALSMIIGVGGNILFAIRLGEGKKTQASLVMNNSLMLLVLVAFFSLTAGQIFMEPLLRLFGASDETFPQAQTYLRIVLCGAFFQTVTPGMNHFIRSLGHPRAAMARNLVGAFCNVGLDWLFIMKFRWGIAGAAWATVVSQLVATLFVVAFFFRKDVAIRLRLAHMRLQFPFVRKILLMGLPASVMQICNSLMNAILNGSLAHYGDLSRYSGDLAISSFGIINGVMMMICMPVVGLVTGAQPIIGYNYGARKYARVRKTLKAAFVGAISFMTVCWAVVQLGSYEIAAMFVSPDPSESEARLVELAGSAMRIYAAALPAIAFGMVAGNFFQGTGKAKRAMFLNACRQLILLIPMLLVFPRFFGLKGVFAAQPVSDALSAVLAGTLLSFELKHMRSFEASGNSADEKDRL